jgi:integrase
MRKRNSHSQPKPGQIGAYWLSKKPGRDGTSDAWCRTWYDPGKRQTCRVSLGTADFQEGSLALANWVIENGKGDGETRPDCVLIERVLLQYWNEHAKNLASAKTAWNGLAYWQEFWQGKNVAAITPKEQREFRNWLSAKGTDAGGIDRVLADGRAALKRAVKWQELSNAPHIFQMQTAEDRRSREPLGRPIVPVELARLFDAAKSRHMLMYLVIASNTLARPGAILDLRGAQFDESHNRVDLNPPGRKQNKKFRPVLPATPTLLPWLRSVTEPTQRYIVYSGKAVKSVDSAWKLLRKDAGLDERVTPYSIRHGIAREMRKRKVPKEQISMFLGHLPKASDATTSIYAPYEPEYCSEAVAAIEDVMAEVRKHFKRANIDEPLMDAGTLAKSIPSKTKAGTGDVKREEVRFLILSGLPHAEVVKRSGVSSGTVSLIRNEIRDVMPLYRNSESGTCVPFACRGDKIRGAKTRQAIEIIGGPGGTRTPDQTVMSGQL